MPRRAGIGGLGHGLGAGSLAGKHAAQFFFFDRVLVATFVVVCPKKLLRAICRAASEAGRQNFYSAKGGSCILRYTHAQVRAHDVGGQLTAHHREQMVQPSKIFKVWDVMCDAVCRTICIRMFSNIFEKVFRIQSVCGVCACVHACVCAWCSCVCVRFLFACVFV